MEQTLAQLDELFVRIAEALGIALDVVQESGMEYIMMYGRYESHVFFFGWTLAGIIFGIVAGLVALCIWGDGGGFESGKELVLVFTIPFIACIIIGILIGCMELIPYYISPEIFSIKEAIKLIQ